MLIEIEKTIKVVESIEVIFPYYFVQYLDYCTIYGRLSETHVTTITISDDDSKFEIEHDSFDTIKTSGYSSYLKQEYKSSAYVYRSAEEELLSFIKNQMKIS